MPVVKADAPVYGGYVISRNDGVIFIKGAIPGELVEVEISERKRDYSVASVTDVIEPSSSRVTPRCGYFGSCGGCQLQFISYEKQVSMKDDVLRDCLARIGGLRPDLLPPLTGGDFAYRRRGQFKVSEEGRAGFYREGTREVVSIEGCPLMVEEINEILGKMRTSLRAGIKEVHVTCGDSAIALIKGIDFDEAVAEGLMGLGLAGVAFQDGSHSERGYVGFDLHGLTYTVGPWSFFQSNWELNGMVVELIERELRPLEGKRVLDLYAGAGNFSLLLSRYASEVVAVEENPHAVKDAQRNLTLNKIRNFRLLRGRAETVRLGEGFDVVILDPPRPGLTAEAMDRVLKTAPQRIAYVSCNPSTLARDLKRLAEKYEIQSIRMIDFFPNTFHIEALAFLTRREAH
jgi:23S rRNA (uracil1939-C5)-methyltransferase